jgi:four helix bundle protein
MTHDQGSTTHKRLVVWQRARLLARECYQLAKKLPPDERFELGSQLRRAGASAMGNIAEGKGRRTKPEFAQFLSIARGSAREVDSHLDLCEDVGFLTAKDVHHARSLAEEVSRMLTAMMRNLTPF